MRLFPSRFSAFLITFLVLLVTGQALASGLVLCVGQDGHSAFEQAYAGKCTPVQPSCPTEGECSFAACNDDHCGPCQDFSAPSDSLRRRTHGDQDLSTLLLLPPVADVPDSTVAIFIRDLKGNLFPQPPPQPYHALTALRTVVLLN